MKPPYFIFNLILFTIVGCSTATNNSSPAQLAAPAILVTPTACPKSDISHIHTGTTRNGHLITHTDMDHEIHTPIADGKVLVLIESSKNGHQWLVYYLPTCQFGYLDKNEVILDE